MPENNNNGVIPAVAASEAETFWTCAGCEDNCSSKENKCKKCNLCIFCCDAWSCDICITSFCGEINKRCTSCAKCSGCCNCWSCTGCERKIAANRPACTACGQCRNGGCCRCWACHNCNTTFREAAGNSCRECGICNRCCQCSGIDRYVPKNVQFHKANSVTGFKRNKSHRFVAAEIEIAKVENDKLTNIYDTVKKWNGAIVDDGSLPRDGFEINTAPSNGDLYVAQVTDICDALKSQGAKINNQCGLHVHVDARDYTYYDLRRLVIAYSKIEDSLFNMVAPDRVNSRYCHPCAPGFVKNVINDKNPESSKKRIISNVYGTNIDNLDTHFMQTVRTQKYNNARYAALNIHSWFFRGTMECRMHQGTKSARHIINWGMLWAGILDFAMKTPESKITSMSKDTNSLIDMAPTTETKDWIVARTIYFKAIRDKKTAPKTQTTATEEMINNINRVAYNGNVIPAALNVNTATFNGNPVPGAQGRARFGAAQPVPVDNNFFDFDEETV